MVEQLELVEDVKIVERPKGTYDWELPPSQWVPDKKVKTCFMCNKEFGVFLWKSHCRKCGRVFCKTCIKERIFDVDGSRLLDPGLIKARERELKELKLKIRETKICLECDATFENFEYSVTKTNELTQSQKTRKQVDAMANESTMVSEFVAMLSQEKQLNSEAYKRLKEFASRHIANVLYRQLVVNDLDPTEWFEIVNEFVMKAADQIRPSSRQLNDPMDFNQFVKVKVIQWPDQSKSQYVNGFVFSKTVADRRMLSQFENPTVLILKNTMEVGQADLQSEMDQEEHLIKILSTKLEVISPQILMLGEDVSYKVMCMLRDQHKITVVSSIDKIKLDKIARLCQTVTANGVTSIDKRFVLGKCASFRVEQIGPEGAGKQLMRLEGCDPALGCTMLISGPNLEELAKVKLTIKQVLPIVRSIILEKFFLTMLQIQAPELPALQGPQNLQTFEETDQVSPFLVTCGIENRAVLVYHEFKITLKTESSEEQKINEKFVHSKIDKICGSPQKQMVSFYNGNDITIGKYLKQFHHQCGYTCQICDLKLAQHATEVYHADGFVKVQQEFKPKLASRMTTQFELIERDQFLFRLRCKQCNKQSNPLPLSTQMFEYSLARFFEQLFYNRKSYGICCADSTIADYQFVFDLDSVISVTFCYNQTDVYDVQQPSIKSFDNSKHLALIVQDQIENLVSNVHCVMEQSKERFRFVRHYIQLHKQQSTDPSHQFFMQLFKTVEAVIDQLDTNISIMLNEGIMVMSQLKTEVFKAYFVNRKLVLSLISFQTVFNQVTRFAAVLIVLARRRTERMKDVKDDYLQVPAGIGKQPCFIEELMSYKQQNILPDRKCPISGQQSSCCNDAQFIVGTYNEICYEIEDEYHDMSIEKHQHKGSFIVPIKHKSLWVDKMFNPFMTLPLGFNNIHVQVNPDDIGSIIAYAITSNVYVEGLYKMGYLGLQQPNLPVTNLQTLQDNEMNNAKLELQLVKDHKFTFKVKFGAGSIPKVKIKQDKKDAWWIQQKNKFTSNQDLQQTILPQYNQDLLQTHDSNITSLEHVFQALKDHYLGDEVVTRLMQHVAKINRDFLPVQSPQMNTSQSYRDRESTSVEVFKTPSSQRSSASNQSGGFVYINEDSPVAKGILQTRHHMSEKSKRPAEFECSLPVLNIPSNTIFEIDSPLVTIKSEIEKCGFIKHELDQQFEVTVLFPLKFEALRRAYCGVREEYIQSIFKVESWKATGGRTSAAFSKTHDEKYVIKEIKEKEFLWFVEFGQVYFEYMAKVLFKNQPCALAKILGAYVVKQQVSGKPTKKYVLILENLNLGISPQEEKHVVRYDLKGSELNRFIKNAENDSVVQLDSNFLLQMNGRPIVMKKQQAYQLHQSLDLDSHMLAKTNIIDYSLLTIINRQAKTIRFGVIDYLQMYTMQRFVETQYKRAINRGKDPTIIEPSAYRERFTSFAKLYLIGVDTQVETRQRVETKEDIIKQIEQGRGELAALLNK